jgi:polar amino acid transport system substrate-binding protein
MIFIIEMRSNMRKFVRISLFEMMVVCVIWLSGGAAESRDLKASFPAGMEHAVFIELIKLIDEVYPEGTIRVEICPFARSIKYVEEGEIDFHLPLIHNPLVSSENLRYRPIHEPLGPIDFVIYSHVDNPITRDKLDAAQKLSPFPYVLETDRGHAHLFDFPIEGQSTIEQMLKKLQAKRIDGFIYSQNTDHFLRELRIKEVYRAYCQTYDVFPIVRKDANGDEVDRILSTALKTLKETGKLQQLWKRVSVPYQNWQPSEMGW